MERIAKLMVLTLDKTVVEAARQSLVIEQLRPRRQRYATYCEKSMLNNSESVSMGDGAKSFGSWDNGYRQGSWDATFFGRDIEKVVAVKQDSPLYPDSTVWTSD
jgi:hypothetical protein